MLDELTVWRVLTWLWAIALLGGVSYLVGVSKGKS